MDAAADRLRQRRVAVHLAIDLQLRRALGEQRRASRILRADCESSLPKLECDSSATLGVMPKRRTASAASRVISAICSAVGSRLTWVSQMNSVPCGSSSPFIAANTGASGRAADDSAT